MSTIMNQIDPRLKEACPEPNAILRFLKTKDCGILDVQSVQVESIPCLKFTYKGDGVELLRILTEKRYLPVSESQGEFITYAFKRKLLTISAGQVFTVPQDYRTRGRIVAGSAKGDNTSVSTQENAIEPGRSYAILRFADGEKLPVVLEVDPEQWGTDWKANAAKANGENQGQRVSFEEMRWIYLTALLAIPE